MLANSKLVYTIINLVNLMTPTRRLSIYLKYFLQFISLSTRNTVFMALSLILSPQTNMRDFRVKLGWVILNADMLVVDAWRVTDMILNRSTAHLFKDPFYDL